MHLMDDALDAAQQIQMGFRFTVTWRMAQWLPIGGLNRNTKPSKDM